MRYITIPSPVFLRNPETDAVTSNEDGTPQMMGFDKLVRAMFATPAMTASADVFTLIDLRARLLRTPGTVVELSDDEHALLVPHAKRPTMITAVFVYMMAPFFHAILDAPDKPKADEPKAEDEPASDAAAE